MWKTTTKANNKKIIIIGIVLFSLFLIGCVGDEFVDKIPDIIDDSEIKENQTKEEPTTSATFKLANWNIQIFGKSKWAKPEAREKILEVLPNYDIIFVQEIRDSSGESFDKLCEAMEGYGCAVSTRAGRSTSKEQYGILWKHPIEMIGISDYNPDELDRWERPPVEATFNVSGYIFRATNIHAKPNDVDNELKELEMLYVASSWEGNRVWLGDLNADGSYYDEDNKNAFTEMHWIIQDSDDTTVAKSNNTYDRIIMNDEMFEEYVDYGIYKDINKNVSDHYLVWVEINSADV